MQMQRAISSGAQYAPAESPGQDRERGLLAAAEDDVPGVILHRVVRQGGARHFRVGDAVVAEGPATIPLANIPVIYSTSEVKVCWGAQPLQVIPYTRERPV